MEELTEEQKAAKAAENAAKAEKKAADDAAKLKAVEEQRAAKAAADEAVKAAAAKAAEEKAAKKAADDAAKAAAKKALEEANQAVKDAVLQAEATKTKYEVLRPLNHNHDIYPVGSYVKLTDEEAEEHVMHRVIKVATVEVPLT